MYPIRSDKNTHVTTDQVTTFSVFENLPKSRIQHFNIASEASYVYILSGQKFIKNAQNGPSWRLFVNLKLAVKQFYQTGKFLIGQKLVENAKIQKFKCDNLSNFQTL